MITMRSEDEGATGGFRNATGVRGYQEDEGNTDAAEAPTSSAVPVPEAEVEVMVPAGDADDLTVSGTPEAVRRWIQHASMFERAKTACQVMAGFELVELKRSMGFVQGGRRGQKPNDSVFASWEEYVVGVVGISVDTARNWMKMAEALKPRLRKLPGLGHLIREIIDVPLSQLPPEKCRLLENAVHKLADGKSQLDFMDELGITKKAQGSAAKGGNLGGGRPGRGSEDASAEAQEQIARDDWTAVGQKLQIARASFTLLRDEEIDALIGAMTATLAGMRRWRQAPKALRDDALVREVAAIVEG